MHAKHHIYNVLLFVERLLFHQKLLVVETFVRHNGLSLRLLKKLVKNITQDYSYLLMFTASNVYFAV